MKQIKITDMLTLRQEALRMAITTMYGVDIHSNLKEILIKRATDIADYLKGNAILPEYVDTSKMFTDVMEKMNDRWNPSSQWISVDSEMRPAIDTQVLVMISGVKEPMFGKYTETGWVVPNVASNAELVAWMPIPPFTQPTL